MESVFFFCVDKRFIHSASSLPESRTFDHISIPSISGLHWVHVTFCERRCKPSKKYPLIKLCYVWRLPSSKLAADRASTRRRHPSHRITNHCALNTNRFLIKSALCGFFGWFVILWQNDYAISSLPLATWPTPWRWACPSHKLQFLKTSYLKVVPCVHNKRPRSHLERHLLDALHLILFLTSSSEKKKKKSSEK